MASGSQNMTTYNARIVTGSNSAASPEGALLLSGAGRADDATGDTWIFLDSNGGLTNPWGIKHDEANNKLQIFGSGTNSFSVRMDTGDTYILGKVGIGYDPETSGNTYKLYVNGTSLFNDTYILGKVGIGYDPETSGNSYKLYVNGSIYSSSTIIANNYIIAGTYVQAKQDMYMDAGHFYMKYNDTWYDVLHNHDNGNISVNAAGTGLYVGYYNTTLVNWMSGRMQLKEGCLSIFPNNSNYREGIRIHSNGSWSDITLCGDDNIVDSGISANSWFIGNNNGNFYIARNGSPGSTAYIGCVSNVWKVVTAADIPEGAANLSATASVHTLSIYRNGITIPYQMDNVNDGGMLRVRGTAESNCILELGTWDDSGSGETIQFNYYPTTSQVTPTYSVSVPKHSGTLVTTDGHGASGSWGISITGNAASANTTPTVSASAVTNANVNAMYTTGLFQIQSLASGQSLPVSVWASLLVLNYLTNGNNSRVQQICWHDNEGDNKAHYTRTCYNGTWTAWKRIWIQGNSVTNAVWNDLGESRKSNSHEPGYAIAPSGARTSIRLESGARIISDTWGFLLGDENDTEKVPVAISGRVLAYPLYDKSYYEVGDAVCAAEGGKIDKMTRDEIMMYPDRILGIVNEIPDYDIWEPSREGGGREPIHTNGRIWVDVR